MYPLPRTVSSTVGLAGSSRSFSRSRATCMSIVRVGRPSGLIRQTLASSSSRAMARPRDCRPGSAVARPPARKARTRSPSAIAHSRGGRNRRLPPGIASSSTSLRPLRRAAQHRLDPRQQFLHAERLDDIVIGPARSPSTRSLLFAAGGQDDHRLRGTASHARPAGSRGRPCPAAPGRAATGRTTAAPPSHAPGRRGPPPAPLADEPQRIDDPAANRGIVFDGENGFGHIQSGQFGNTNLKR